MYGNCTELRELLEARGQAYVLRVASTFMIQTPSGDRLTCAEAVTKLAGGAGQGWQGPPGRRRIEGTPLVRVGVDRHRLTPTPPPRAPFPAHRRTGDNCYVPDGQPSVVSRLIRAAGLRWPVEECFEFGKDHLGLDQCQARLHTAIARHAVLAMAALAVCAVTAAGLRHHTDSQAPPPTTPRPATTGRTRTDP